MSLRVATAGLDLMADALQAQGADVAAVEWRPPGSGDPGDLAALAATYGDAGVDAANDAAVARLQEARPMIVGAARAGDAIPGLEGRTILHAGPAIEWDAMVAPQRNAVIGACLLEGWATTAEDAHALMRRAAVRLAPAHSMQAAGAMCGVISPSMACWIARDEVGGGVGYCPFNDGPGEAFWLGVGSPQAVERQRLMADVIAPGFDAAIRTDGPIDALGLCAQGIAMGDDCHMRHQATTMLLLRQALPAMAERAPASVAPTARLLAGNGHFALPVTIAAARAALEGIRGIAGSSLVVFISRNGVEAAVQVAGIPDRWFCAPAPMVGEPLYRPGFSDADAAPDIGDSALVECCGLGGAASAASPSVAAFLGGGLADAVERTRRMGDICVARSERLRIPTLDGEGTPLGVDARACVDLGETPLINTGILHRAAGGQIGAGIASTPLEPFREAVAELARRRQAAAAA